ncbi:protein CLP1 homolog [Leptinotarsa decemlineata]|uniref:protein CLP1 homolog n=1 Tax=Leptinotarsa decemlineata TaxID=7539 RepID=UPI000C253B5D|nr:protein CLP1 homolog [Leptinotarsa decemlineata]XP_023017711.1 protein CLP1 homolog [Leptinotarsa decemlineata]
MTMDKKVLQEYNLEQDQELRFEVESKSEKVYLTLKKGTAEVFGTEIVKGKTYEFTAGAKVAVFTWHGCVVEVKGKTDVIYTAKETPMVIYSNCHGALEFMRTDAEKDNKRGPIAMLVGPNDVGKSTICRILLNYAVRMGRRPIFVDLDVGQGHISIPGTIGALMIERPASIDEGFSQEAPLVYNFGHKTPGSNITLFNMLVQKLAGTVKERLEVNKRTRSSGAIINTCGWTKAEGYKQLLSSAKCFEVDVILVLDQERLYNELVRDVPNFVKVVFLPKSGGVVERSKSVRGEARDQRIREYFYGTPSNSLYPHSFDVKFFEVKIFKVGAPALPDSCLPLGMKADDHMTKLVVLSPNAGLLHHILAVSVSEKEDDEVISSHVAGFVCVTNVDTERQILTLLSPQPKPLPNHILVLSELQFMDTH